MSDASKTTTSNAGPAADNAADPEIDGKATPPKPTKYTIPRKLGADTPSPSNHGVDGDRSSRDRGEVVQSKRIGQLAPSQLDQTMAQAVVGADAAAAETRRMRGSPTFPQIHPYQQTAQMAQAAIPDHYNNPYFSQFAAQLGLPMHPATGLNPSTPHGFGGAGTHFRVAIRPSREVPAPRPPLTLPHPLEGGAAMMRKVPVSHERRCLRQTCGSAWTTTRTSQTRATSHPIRMATLTL